MKKIINAIITAIAHVFVGIDNVLYRTFGFVSCFRRHHWGNKARNIQAMLNYQHSRKDRYNKLHGTNLTTKAVMSKIKD